MPRFVVQHEGTKMLVFHASKNQGLSKHTHSYPHLTMCHAGSCVISNARRSLVVTKDTQPVNLVANEWHEIEALEDGTVFVNVFAEGKIWQTITSI